MHDEFATERFIYNPKLDPYFHLLAILDVLLQQTMKELKVRHQKHVPYD